MEGARMSTDLYARLGPVEFFGQARHRGSRIGFGIEGDGLTGWVGGVAPRFDVIDRPLAHGAFDTPSRLGPRVLSLAGPIVARDMRELDNMIDQLVGVLASGQLVKLEVEQSGMSRWAMVKAGGAPAIDPEYWGPRARYELHLWAPDPRRYGESRTLGAVVSHRGNTTATPRRIVVAARTAMMHGYTLRLVDVGGEPVARYVLGPLYAGQRHVIDMRSGTVRRAGVLDEGAVRGGAPFGVPAFGEYTLQVVPELGVGAGDVESVSLVDTYI